MPIDPAPRALARPTLIAAAALCLASLALFWPGTAMYDTVAQYRQVLAGVYDDWHPPAMARVWALLAPFGPGATPMLVLQLATYWLGLGLLAGALARIGRQRSAAAILVIGLLPPFLGWQGVVLKDAQLAGALLAAVGIIGWWRLAGRRLPRAMWIPVTLLLGYAVLVRANAVFIVVPLVVTLAPAPHIRSPSSRARSPELSSSWASHRSSTTSCSTRSAAGWRRRRRSTTSPASPRAHPTATPPA
ncbi:hypothetical protein QP162_13740 [Sphingomonas aurantiaca]|uniref:hypothetical protein n=1 Tax=Sphingomonas aurantiaca TaxID=185949 RepID=UPI002FE0D916